MSRLLLAPAAESAEPPPANITLSDECVRVGEPVTIVDRSVDPDGESGLRADLPRAEHR